MLERIVEWTMTVDPSEPGTHIASKVFVVLGIGVVGFAVGYVLVDAVWFGPDNKLFKEKQHLMTQPIRPGVPIDIK